MKSRESNTATAVRNLIRRIHDHVQANEVASRTAQLFHPQYGRIDILPGDRAEIESVTEMLYQKRDKTLIARRIVANWIHVAILTSLTSDEADFEQKVSAAVSEFEDKWTEPPAEYAVYYPVDGVEPSTLPFSFGSQVEFQLLDANSKEEFSIAADQATNPIQKDYMHKQIERIWEVAGNDRPYVKVTVAAVDDESARNLAEPTLQISLDCLNFLANYIPFNHGTLSLPGDAGTAQIVSPLLRRSGLPGIGAYYKTISPFGLYDLSRTREVGNLFQAVVGLLSPPRSKLANVLLASIRWAGRATNERRPEQAFLLNVIALEALLLSDNEPGELNYRLRLRLAHLLGKTDEDRRAIYRAIPKLYKTRSQIVHAGKMDVDFDEVKEIRKYALDALATVLLEPAFVEAKTPDDLRVWFDERILAQHNVVELPAINPAEEQLWEQPEESPS